MFKELHAALILDVAGQKKEAAKRFERSYKLDPTALRVVQSYGSFLSRQGNNADALKVFAAFEEALPRHPLILEAANELNAGKKLPLMVDTPQAGAAEVLYGLGASLGRLGGRISASSTCSFRSISRPRIRSPCCRSATSTRR
jgi:tetratricopeptide (TPR) repeat protein